MSTALMVRDDNALTIQFTQTAIELKDQALNASALISRVSDSATNQACVEAQKKLSEVIRMVNLAEEEAKEPLNKLRFAIIDTAKKFREDLKEEEIRLSGLAGDYQKLEQAKARAAELAKQAEERRIAEERRQAELAAMRAAEAEKRKLDEQAREVARLAAEAQSKREKELLAQQQAEIDRQKALAEAKSHEELDRINKQHCDAIAQLAEQPKYEPVRASGQRIEEDWDVTVTDVWALARAHPGAVKIEPLIGQIKAMLKSGQRVAGVKATPIVKAGVSRGRTLAAIEV